MWSVMLRSCVLLLDIVLSCDCYQFRFVNLVCRCILLWNDRYVTLTIKILYLQYRDSLNVTLVDV